VRLALKERLVPQVLLVHLELLVLRALQAQQALQVPQERRALQVLLA
jgi:hypothetical protein